MHPKGGLGDPQGYPLGAPGVKPLFIIRSCSILHQRCNWISFKDLESDLEYFTFEPPPGVPLRPGGTPRGAPRGKSFFLSLDQGQSRNIGVFLDIIEGS